MLLSVSPQFFNNHAMFSWHSRPLATRLSPTGPQSSQPTWRKQEAVRSSCSLQVAEEEAEAVLRLPLVVEQQQLWRRPPNLKRYALESISLVLVQLRQAVCHIYIPYTSRSTKHIQELSIAIHMYVRKESRAFFTRHSFS